jgi:hypothetical protein
MNEWFLISRETLDVVRAALEAAGMTDALHELDSGANITDVVPEDWRDPVENKELDEEGVAVVRQ